MAFRSPGHLYSMLRRARGVSAGTSYATATAPKLKAYAPSAAGDIGRAERRAGKPWGEYVPVCVAVGMILLSVTLGLHTAKQHIMYSPMVRVNKSRRETVPEVVEPERVVEESENFLTRSFFRKLAHVQDIVTGEAVDPDPIRKDAFAHRPKAETLRSVSVKPAPKHP
ncbi:uncharacterized protein LOC115753802 [Rhodamnia argentea]|uniref:Uncharacterized protein LOC115753802 n=1 Tax=Rhodamnia argentea TaxID=178133 RepID=A0A8B8QN54_9MYRT|nr:uncharacterized protein LOC115753802 [Rhodamnia argentea]